MENASKALLMAGTVLIAMLIVALGVYLASNFRQTSETYYKRWSTEEVERYNTEITKNFRIENNKTYISLQGIITLYELLETPAYKDLTIMKWGNQKGLGEKTKEELLQEQKGALNYYEVTKIERESDSGIIKTIQISSNTESL